MPRVRRGGSADVLGVADHGVNLLQALLPADLRGTGEESGGRRGKGKEKEVKQGTHTRVHTWQPAPPVAPPHLQLVLEVNVRRGQESVDTVVARLGDGLVAAVDVRLARTRQAADGHWPVGPGNRQRVGEGRGGVRERKRALAEATVSTPSAGWHGSKRVAPSLGAHSTNARKGTHAPVVVERANLVRNGGDGLKVAFRGNGEARLADGDAQARQLVRNRQLLGGLERDSRRLLAWRGGMGEVGYCEWPEAFEMRACV